MRINFLDEKYDGLEDCNISLVERILDEYDCSLYDLINLCGGIPGEYIDNFSLIATPNTSCSIDITIKTDQYWVNRGINFESKYIFNNNMRVYDEGNFLGTQLFLNQITSAKGKNFNMLRVFAAGMPGQTLYTGYYKWSRVGYFLDKDSQAEFKQWAMIRGIKEKSLHEYVKDDSNYVRWQFDGFYWSGYFQLNDDSSNMQYLREYLNRKGIEYKI